MLCAGHHRALHEGILMITGAAPGKVVALPEPDPEVAHVGVPAPANQPSDHRAPTALDADTPAFTADDVRKALQRLGFGRCDAAQAVECALAKVGDADIEALLRAALRECPRPIA